MTGTPIGGYIYILFNPALRKDYLKIGLTERAPDVRAKELSRETGVPQEFVVAYQRPVSNPKNVEQKIHRYLEEYRVNKKREFFAMPLKDAVRVVEKLVDQEAAIENWKGMTYLKSNAIARWRCLSGDLLVITRYKNIFANSPEIIDVWEARDDGDELVFSSSPNFDVNDFVPEVYLSETMDLKPGDRVTWVSKSRNSVFDTPPPTMAHLEFHEPTTAFALSLTPRMTPDGYPILFSTLSASASVELARLAYENVISFGLPRVWAEA